MSYSTPPPFTPPAPPKKKSNVALIITVVLVVILVPCIALIIFFGQMARAVTGNLFPMAACTEGIERVRDAVVAYSAKNGKYPPAEKWEDEIRDFYKAEYDDFNAGGDQDFIKLPPVAGPWGCKVNDSVTGFAYNKDVAGKTAKDVKNDVILIFETASTERNQAAPYKPQPKDKAPSRFGGKDWLRIPVVGVVEGFMTDMDPDASSKGAEN